MEPAIADLLGQLRPATPQSNYDRALILAMLDERADGLKSLATTHDVGGQLVLAQYRQEIGDGAVGDVIDRERAAAKRASRRVEMDPIVDSDRAPI